MSKRLLDTEFDAQLTSRHMISDLVLASSFDDDHAPMGGDNEFDYEEEALADFGLSSSNDPRRRNLMAAALAAVGRNIPETPSPVSSQGRSGDLDAGDALDLGSNSQPRRGTSALPQSTITFIQEPVLPRRSQVPPPVPTRTKKTPTRPRAESGHALVNGDHDSEGEDDGGGRSDDEIPASSSMNTTDLSPVVASVHESKELDSGTSEQSRSKGPSQNRPSNGSGLSSLGSTDIPTFKSSLSLGLRGGSEDRMGTSSGLASSLTTIVPANRGVHGDLFRCTVYLPFIPREHDSDEPHLVQMQLALDSTAQQLVNLARQRFVQDLHHRPELIGPVLGNHIRRLRCRRLKIPYVPIPLTSSTDSREVALTDDAHVYGMPSVTTHGPGKTIGLRPQSGTRISRVLAEAPTTPTTTGSGLVTASPAAPHRTPTLPGPRLLPGSGQRGRTRVQPGHGTPQAPTGGLSSALSSHPYRGTAAAALRQLQHDQGHVPSSSGPFALSGLARSLTSCALSREEMDFTVEDVFGQTLQYQLVVWDFEKGAVNDDIPPLTNFAKLAKQDYDIFALQIVPNAAAARAEARHKRRLAKRQRQAAAAEATAAANADADAGADANADAHRDASAPATGVVTSTTAGSNALGEKENEECVAVGQLARQTSYSNSRSAGSDSSNRRRRIMALGFGGDISDTDMASISGSESVYDPFAYDGVEESADDDDDEDDLDGFAKDGADSGDESQMGSGRRRGGIGNEGGDGNDDDDDDEEEMGFDRRRGRSYSRGGAPPPPPAYLRAGNLAASQPPPPPIAPIPAVNKPPEIPPRTDLQHIQTRTAPSMSVSCVTAATTSRNSTRKAGNGGVLARLFPCCCGPSAQESLQDDEPVSPQMGSSVPLSVLSSSSPTQHH